MKKQKIELNKMMNKGKDLNLIKQYLPGVLRYLGIRNRSVNEIERYLERAIALPQKSKIKLQIIEYLDKNGLIDDIRLASQWVEAKRRKGDGPKKIKFSLSRLGIKKEDIEKGINSISEQEWIESAREVLKKVFLKYSHMKGYAKVNQMYKILSARGFLPAQIRAAIDQIRFEAVE